MYDFLTQFRAGTMTQSRRTNGLVVSLCAALLSLTLSGCEGQPNGDQGPQGSGGGAEFGHELSMHYPPRPAAIAKAQQQLAALGYDPGPVDGMMGKNTRIAIKHYQVDSDLTVDGKLTPAMSTHLERRFRKSQRQPEQPAPPESQPEEADTAPRPANTPGPSYEVNDTYVYSDGRIETVIRVGPERTLWKSAEGNVYTAYRNFILPPISWKSGAARGENQVQPVAGRKWPPATTQEIAFTVGSKAGGDSVDAARSWSGNWRCASGGVSPVISMVGQFDAVVIECQRTNPEPGTWKKRTWYYVPEVGHYVRRIDQIHGTGQKTTVDLVAIRPGGKGWPPAARGGLNWAIQGALDAADYDNIVEWRSSAVGAMFGIRLTGNVDVTGKADCRRYNIERTGPDQMRMFPAIACKTPGAGRWLTPGLDPGSLSPRSLKP